MSIQDNVSKTAPKPAGIPQQQRPPATVVTEPAPTAVVRALAVLRIVLGLSFLWAFLDKLFGLGYSTSSKQAWINGGSPTNGFLSHVRVGPLQSLLRDWAGSGWA